MLFMKKSILCLFVSLRVFIVFGQNTIEPNNYLPNIVPPSIESLNFSKYGDITTGLFTGTPNIQVPLFEYKTKNLTIPFGLNYTSNGIKVDDINSKVGLGWIFNEPGVINRIIRDNEDDLLNDYPMNHLDFTTINRYNAITNQYFNFFGESPELDTERDLFNFNFQGYSGKFYFDINNNVIKLDDSDLRIEVINTIGEPIYTFLVTTGTGVKYFFQSLEETMLRTTGNGHAEPSTSYTSWYLTKIVQPDNEEIYFTYESNNYYFIVSNSQQIAKANEIECGFWAQNTTNGHYTSPVYSHTMRVNGKRLKSITSNLSKNGRVDFEYQDQITNSDTVPDIVIKSITIHNDLSTNSTLIDKIEFNYLTTSNDRIFLTGIHHLDINDNYAFEYISPNNFPERLAKSQDHWGFYNGANNTTLIPKIDDYGFGFLDFNFADREPNSLFTNTGLLNKITYPTKGYTVIEYEPNTYYGSKTILPPQSYQQIQVSSLEGQDGMLSSNYQLINKHTQYIKLNASVVFTQPPCSDNLNTGDFHNTATYRVLNLTTNTYETLMRVLPSGDLNNAGTSNTITSNMSNNVSSVYFNAKNNNDYLITLTINRECLSAQLNFNYISDESTIHTNIITGGMRVKATKNFSLNNLIPKTKRYYYAKKNDLNTSSGDIGHVPFYTYYGHHIIENSTNNLTCSVQDIILSSSSISSIFDTGSNDLYYRYVVVCDDDFSNGYEEFEFSINRDYREVLYLGNIEYWNVPWSNSGWDKGKLLSVKTYAYNNTTNNFFIKKEIQNTYSKISNYPKIINFAVFNPVMGLFATNTQEQCGCIESNINENYPVNYCSTIHFHQKNSSGLCIATNANNINYTIWHPCHNKNIGEIINIPSINHMDIMNYYYYSSFGYLSKTTTSDYFYDSNNGYTGVVNTTDFFNYNPAHLHLSSHENQNSKGQTKITKYYYPQDSEMSSEPFRNELVSKNITSNPLSIQHFKGLSKISEVKTIFNNWGNSLILPYKTQFAKGNANLQNQFQYTAYDSFGNLLELKKENGMIISYLYGYNHTQPIAKIENINNEQLKNILGVTNLELVDETYLPIINNLRSSSLLANAMITSYTYIPLIGISSITDPKGDRVDYTYDSFGRLSETKDINNNTLSKNEIHYKN